VSLPTPYYDEDGITIFNADCREILPHVKADVVVTDPPYGTGYAANPIVGKGKSKSNHSAQSWDNGQVEWLPNYVSGIPSVVWGGNYYRLPPSRCWLVWYKRDAPPSMANAEMAWTSFAANTRVFDWTIAATNGERCGHPTQKPEALMSWTISLCPPGTILDPFMGSGTTLVAAKRLGRRAIGIEIEKSYCDLAVRRLAQKELAL
jgi:DNA modification methylase